MKVGWQTKTLGEVCIVDKRQGVYKNLPYIGLEDIEAHTGRFLGSTNAQEVKSSTFAFSSEHLLYGRLRPYLNKVLAPDFAGHCSTEIFPLKPRPELLRDFLQYWFLREETVKRIDATSTGARMPRANVDAVLNFEFLLPPLPEQRRLVALLDAAFAAIATAKANTEQTLQNARAVFDSHLEAVFSQRGAGWEEKPLGEVCEFVGGSQPPKSTFSSKKLDGYIRLIQIRDYKSEKHIVYIPRAKARRFCNASDVMIGRYGPPVFQILEGLDGAYNVALMKAIPNAKLVSRDFLFFFLQHGSIQRHIIGRSERASGQTGISKEALEMYPIAYPSLHIQSEIVTKLGTLATETQRLEALSRRKRAALAELKQALLHQAFAGAL